MTSHELTKRHWRFAFVVWFTVVTVFTHIPQAPPVPNPTFVSPDKILHFVCFGMLAFMFMCSNVVRRPVLAWFLLLAWVLVDEITQDVLPLGRAFSYEDVVAGALGITSAMIWSGALAKSTTERIRIAFDQVLSIPSNWCTLALVSCVSTVLVFFALWGISKYALGTQYSSFSLVVGIVIGALCALLCAAKLGRCMGDMSLMGKRMAMPMVVTIVVAAMLGFVVSIFMFDAWVIVLTTIVVGTRITWANVT